MTAFGRRCRTARRPARPGLGRRRGFALMIVLSLVAAASVLGLSFTSASTVRVRTADNFARLSRARYLAESGLQHAIYMMRCDSAGLLASSAAKAMGPYFVDDSDDTYSVYLKSQPASDEYVLVARGQCGQVQAEASVRVYCANTYAEQLLDLGPRSYWRLNETSGTRAWDTQRREDGQYCNHVQLNQPGALIGSTDGAPEFDGHNDYVDTGKWSLSGSDLTIACWFKATDFHRDDARLISKATGVSDNQHYFMLSTRRYQGEMRLRFRLRSAGWTKCLHATRGHAQPGRWIFAVAVYTGEEMILYQDGQEVGRCNKSGSLDTHSNVPVWIGGNPSGDRDRPWKGQIDEMAVWSKDLTATQIQALYQARWPEVRVLEWIE